MIPYLLLFVYWFLIPGAVAALELRLENPPADIDVAAETSVNVGLSCASCSNSYLRAVIYSDGTNYFGLTQNRSGEFVGVSGEKTAYYLVSETDTASGSWSGTLKIRVDTDNKYYSGPGKFNLKVIRYTASGSKSGETEAVTVNLLGPPPTPLPTSTPAPTSTPRPQPTSTRTPATPTPKPASSVKVISPTPLNSSSKPVSPTSKPSLTSAPGLLATSGVSPTFAVSATASGQDLQLLSSVSPNPQILASQTAETETVASVSKPASPRPLFWPVIFWSLGGICLISAAYQFRA